MWDFNTFSHIQAVKYVNELGMWSVNQQTNKQGTDTMSEHPTENFKLLREGPTSTNPYQS